MKKLLVFIGILISFSAFSQEKIQYLDIDSIRAEIRPYAESNEFEKVIKVLDKINKNDSIYAPALVTRSFYLLQLKKFDEAISVAKEGLEKSKNDDRLSFHINLSVSYLNLKDYDNAINSANKALEEFPKSDKLYAVLGQIYYGDEQYAKAVEALKTAIILNPFNPDNHIKLGSICYKQHLTAEALMCYSTYLALSPDGQNSFQVLNSVNTLLQKSNDNEKVKGFKISKDDKSFEDIDLILDNRIALNKDYKIDNQIDIAFVRQNHALMQQLGSYNGNGGFWETTYVTLYKWITQNNYFDDFVYTTVYSIENPDYKKIVAKKTDNVVKFYRLFREKLSELMQENEFVFEGKNKKCRFTFTIIF